MKLNRSKLGPPNRAMVRLEYKECIQFDRKHAHENSYYYFSLGHQCTSRSLGAEIGPTRYAGKG